MCGRSDNGAFGELMIRPLLYNSRNATHAGLRQVVDAKIVIEWISARQTKVKFLQRFQALIAPISAKKHF
jgi:hypothetical protein